MGLGLCLGLGLQDEIYSQSWEKNNLELKEKFFGMLYGTIFGDMVGLPFEGCSRGVVNRVPVSLNNMRWSDDTQLTFALLDSLLDKGKVDIGDQKDKLASAYKEGTFGWGSTTRQAAINVVEGIEPSAPFTPGSMKQGYGNGACMRISPLAFVPDITFDEVSEVCLISHATSMAVSSTLAHVAGLQYCKEKTPESFKGNEFLECVVKASEMGEKYGKKDYPFCKDNLADRLKKITPCMSKGEIYELVPVGGKYAYVYNSLPLTYSFFVKAEPSDYPQLEEVIFAGGDTDTNASMLGSLLGTLHGKEVFSDYISGLYFITDLVDDYTDKFMKKFYK